MVDTTNKGVWEIKLIKATDCDLDSFIKGFDYIFIKNIQHETLVCSDYQFG